MFSKGTSKMKHLHMHKTTRKKSALDNTKGKHKVVSEVRTVGPSPDPSAPGFETPHS